MTSGHCHNAPISRLNGSNFDFNRFGIPTPTPTGAERLEIERAEIRKFFIKYAQEDEAKRERCKRIAFWQMWVGIKSNDSRGDRK
jgi:hypothetical protein